MTNTLIFTAIIAAITGAAAYFICRSLRHFGELEDSHLTEIVDEISKPVRTPQSLLPPKSRRVPRFPVFSNPDTLGMPEHVVRIIERDNRRMCN